MHLLIMVPLTSNAFDIQVGQPKFYPWQVIKTNMACLTQFLTWKFSINVLI
jgi:hypothetical protein